jgi:hypothetical protein
MKVHSMDPELCRSASTRRGTLARRLTISSPARCRELYGREASRRPSAPDQMSKASVSTPPECWRCIPHRRRMVTPPGPSVTAAPIGFSSEADSRIWTRSQGRVREEML